MYAHDIQVFANGRWHTATAALWGARYRSVVETWGVRNDVNEPENWSGRMTLQDDNTAVEVYHDDGRKLRLPNGQERTFSVSACFENAMNIRGHGSIPFD